MIALLRRQPVVSFYVLALAWTWAFVIVFLIVFPLPDLIVRTTPGDLGPLIANYFRPDWAATNGGLMLSGITVFTGAAVALSIIIARAYNRTGGSVLVGILIHPSLNFSQGLTGDLFPAARDNEVAPVLGFVVFAAAIVIATRGRLGYPGAAAVAGRTPAYSTTP